MKLEATVGNSSFDLKHGYEVIDQFGVVFVTVVEIMKSDRY